jgi:hypothetical protein
LLITRIKTRFFWQPQVPLLKKVLQTPRTPPLDINCCASVHLWYFLPFIYLVKLEKYNFSKWSQMMNKITYSLFYDKNRIYWTKTEQMTLPCWQFCLHHTLPVAIMYSLKTISYSQPARWFALFNIYGC